MSKVLQILIARSAGSAMEPQEEVRAVPGKGLVGDRYFIGQGTFSPAPQRPDYELTLIENENVEGFARESGLAFDALHSRRNIVTEGISLNDLVGKEFAVGSVRIRAIRLCEPCRYLAKLTFAETLNGLAGKGGLRAQILTEGIIRVGDPILL